MLHDVFLIVHSLLHEQWFEIREAFMTRVNKTENDVEKQFRVYQSRWEEYAKCAGKAGGSDYVEVCVCRCMNNQ